MKIPTDPVTLATPFFILTVILEIVFGRLGAVKANYEAKDTATSLTMGLFSTLFLLFLKFVPAVSVTEVKELRHELAHDPTTDPVGETH